MQQKMTTSELYGLVAAKCQITPTQGERYLKALIAVIYEGLARDKKVTLQGFGTFRVKELKPHETGIAYVPKMNAVRFTAGSVTKEKFRG